VSWVDAESTVEAMREILRPLLAQIDALQSENDRVTAENRELWSEVHRYQDEASVRDRRE
jgi:hypothetical protein